MRQTCSGLTQSTAPMAIGARIGRQCREASLRLERGSRRNSVVLIKLGGGNYSIRYIEAESDTIVGQTLRLF